MHVQLEAKKCSILAAILADCIPTYCLPEEELLVDESSGFWSIL